MKEVVVPDFEERLATFQSTKFTLLRPGQRTVLAAYAEHHLNTPDLAIEMPTGEGKTLLALLMADHALDQGRSVAYLTGTRQLAEHVEHEAGALGLDVVRFAGKDYGGAKLDDYHQAQAIGVMNYWVYFNSSPVPQAADLVIFDDAHLAEQPLSALHTVRIPDREGPARVLYRTICDLVIAHTDAYSGLTAMRDGMAQPGMPPELLSFTDWTAVSTSVSEAIDSSPFSKDQAFGSETERSLRKEIRWVWPKVRQHLTRCGVLIGSSGVEIRPYHPPTALNAGYNKAKQRVYLSATLGSMDDLQRRIGSGEVVRLWTGGQSPAAATGERVFVLNPSAAPAADATVVSWALAQAHAADGRAAWLCASNAEADILQGLLESAGENVYRLRTGDDAVVDKWSRADTGHLITAGRYDGLDFAGDICRLVIITTVPQASSEFEKFVTAYLGDATFIRHRVGQRVTQALGRANRVETDRSLYIGLDPKFAQVLADPAVRASIPNGTQGLVREALELYDQGWDETLSACDEFWSVSQTSAAGAHHVAVPASPPRRPRPGRGAATGSQVASAHAEVSAVTDLWLGGHASAARHAGRAADLLATAGETEHGAFWRYVQAHALFDRGRTEDRASARNALIEATQEGPRTSWFRRLGRTIDELDGVAVAGADSDSFFLAWDEWRREAGGRLERIVAGGRAQLAGTHDEQCDGLRLLARLAGVNGTRPPKSEQAATDCRWTWSTVKRSQRRVWEVKTGKPHPVNREDINQLLGQIEVERRQASGKARVYGCLLTPSGEAQAAAVEAAHDMIALIHHDAAISLYDVLADRLRQYDSLCADGNAGARGTARAEVEALLPDEGWLVRLLSPRQGSIVTSSEVMALFPQR